MASREEAAQPLVYIAGPFGFTEAGRVELREVVLPILACNGLRPLNPWSVGADILAPHLGVGRNPTELLDACRRVGEVNAAMIRESDAVMALLDGCDIDSGTAAEVGFAAALAKPTFGVRTDTRSCGDFPELAINLQVQFFIESTGGRIVATFDSAVEGLVELFNS